LLEVFGRILGYLIVGIYPIPEKQPEEVYKVIKETVETYKNKKTSNSFDSGSWQISVSFFIKRNEIAGLPPSLTKTEQIVNLAIKTGISGLFFILYLTLKSYQIERNS
jgi:hypothetical protein